MASSAGDPSAVWSLDVSPRPAVPGEDLTVKVDAYTRFPLEVSAPSVRRAAKSVDHKVQGVAFVEVQLFHGTGLIGTQTVDVCKGPYVDYYS